jgi:hypothetical protein
MEIPSFYLSIIAEAIGLIFLVLLGFTFLLKRDKTNLTNYVYHLKEKVATLTKKIKELDTFENPVIDLLKDTIDHIKTTYEKTFGHELGKTDTSTHEDNSKDHFLFVIGYQNLKATLSALENSNTAEHTWEKISSQMSALIENYRIMPETQFETIVEEKVIEKTEQKTGQETNQGAEHETAAQANALKKKASNHNGSVTLVGQDQFINERKSEIDRLKGKISSQFEEIWELQNNVASKVSQSSDPELSTMSEDVQSISRQLKDAELCITMMEADIATSDEEIISLTEQLKQANIRASAIPPSNSELTEDIKKKDAAITHFTQESKEMLTLIDGMENNAMEQSKRIKELEEQLNS